MTLPFAPAPLDVGANLVSRIWDPRRRLRRVPEVGRELIAACFEKPGVGPMPRRVEEGRLGRRGRRAVAVCSHYAPGHGIDPTHHAWQCLIERFGFPFIKRDLLPRNPNGIAGLEGWHGLVPDDAPVGRDVIAAHLAARH